MGHNTWDHRNAEVTKVANIRMELVDAKQHCPKQGAVDCAVCKVRIQGDANTYEMVGPSKAEVFLKVLAAFLVLGILLVILSPFLG